VWLCVMLGVLVLYFCDLLSKKTHVSELHFMILLSNGKSQWAVKIYLVSMYTFGVIVIDSKMSKVTDLYHDYHRLWLLCSLMY